MRVTKNIEEIEHNMVDPPASVMEYPAFWILIVLLLTKYSKHIVQTILSKIYNLRPETII